ncbi:MAG: hypothetical protein JOY72_07440 [Actinobacteria bacterium]|nr:hypothetical protein [Actinomycetota bacterium]MBV8480123.1 hypothetical protein [Actinomycetota bacterium]
MRYVFLAVVVLLLAGCGPHKVKRVVEVIPSDGSFPSVTVTVSGNTPADCANDISTFSDNAHQVLQHEGPQAAYPADLYFLGLHDALRDFQVRGCPMPLLGHALAQRFTNAQLHELIADLPSIYAPALRAGLH